MKTLLTAVLLSLCAGCFYTSRSLVKTDPHVVTSDYYCVYTNGTQEAYTSISRPGEVFYREKTLYYSTSYVGGPWRGSFLYPGTRLDLNILSGWSYSSAASGNYMNNLITLPTYPIYIVALPIELVIDTVLIPFDLWNSPRPGEGWQLKGAY